MSPPPATPETVPTAQPGASPESFPAGARSTAAHAFASTLLEEWVFPGPALPAFQSLIPALEWARSGAHFLTGEPCGPPEFANGPIATAARGLGELLAHLVPDRGFERFDWSALLGERAALAGLERAGRRSAGGGAHILETGDGFIAINLAREDDWHSLGAWLRADFDASDSKREATLARAVAQCRSDALIDQGRLLGLAVVPVAYPEDPVPPAMRLLHATETAARTSGRPLRLLDLSSLWAGPLATSLLAQAGIEVIKIESPSRPDGARRGNAAFFDLMNAGKAGRSFDLSRASDRVAFEALLETADIVVESARPRALEQLGFLAADWTRARAGRIWLSITGSGRSQPERDWIAYGDDAALAAGLGWASDAAVRNRDSDERRAPTTPRTERSEARPRFCGDAIADPLTGLFAAARALALLRAGHGGLLDVSLVGCAARAARHDAGPLSLELEREPESTDYSARLGSHRFRVEAPRARPARGSAPRLQAVGPDQTC